MIPAISCAGCVIIEDDVDVQLLLSVIVTVYVPAVLPEISSVIAPELHENV